MIINDKTEIDLCNPPMWFIDNDDLLCEYPAHVAMFLTEDQWKNLTELLLLDGQVEEPDFVFTDWIIGMLGTGYTTVGKFRAWIDENAEEHL